MNTSTSEAYALSVERYRSGDRLEAAAICEKIVMTNPDHPAAINLLGLMLLDSRQYEEARLLFEKAAALAPDVPEYLNNLGSLHEEQNQPQLAERYFRQAIALNATHPETLSNLGYILQRRQKFDEAADYYREALQLRENDARLLVNLGKCLEEQGKTNQAASCYRKAIAADPQHAIALNNLGGIHIKQGEIAAAIDYYKRSIASQPEFAFTHNNLGVALMQSGQLEAAAASYLNALAIDAKHADALRNLGDVFAYQGNTAEAANYYRQALAIENRPGIRIRLATLLPAILESEESIASLRQGFEEALAELEQDQNLRLSDPALEVRDAFFYLAYHGLNNRDLKIRLARLFERCCPALLWEAPHCASPRPAEKPIKIGILSKYLYNHSIGKTTQGLIAKLPRDRFRICAIFIAPLPIDHLSNFIRDHADETLEIPVSLETARRQIAALELDILFYQDIGMDPFSYFLAFSRLAPLQCTAFGHPETSGIRNLDYFISSELFETANAQSHYSEKLHRLANASLPTYYYRPALPSVLKPRSEYGLQDKDHLYLCPQTLYKFHPSFDRILAAILRGDPAGKLVLLEGPVANFALLLLQRFQESMPDVVNRVTFLPPQNALDFINLIAVSDLMLDIPCFNGMNSSLEAFAAGTPFVTLPGERQCTRHGAGLYRKMGVDGCVAKNPADYIDIALRLGNDPLFRGEISTKIKARNHLLFEDEGAIAAFSDFFEERMAAIGSDLEV